MSFNSGLAMDADLMPRFIGDPVQPRELQQPGQREKAVSQWP